jgi:hypothetical protein
MTTAGLIKDIWRREGIVGFGKGFNACFYHAAGCGFIYFSLYKFLKPILREKMGEDSDLALCYMLSSLGTGIITLSIGYPYELIKCRL